ncbi:sigma-B regulation protein RsbQ [Glaciihabitans tibetensis]|uniref:Sigma-B regulation protein RsbQ n=1 Tax=Glaciihabitans tibetensis TaxID=1266600 RepID=A0A2T0VB80_9MICO|nr:alpha/beta hydrolase [Glaciihabitans tibetensis]PRY67459.1 sigma-B regulation protein RsbQ [Glaciihabitans tibetensis]
MASSAVDVVARNNVTIHGSGRPIVFAHGFGCSQDMWRRVAPHFAVDHQVVLFDHVGAGKSDVTAYRPGKYDSLEGYASDVVEIVEQLDLTDVVLVGHSVGGIIGMLAANREPSRFAALILVGPSPRYVDTDDYTGGFSQVDIDGLLDVLDANYFGWSETMAPVMMGAAEQPELSDELNESFCRTDPTIARHFARVTFLSDNRPDLDDVTVPTLVVQSRDDVIAPVAVGEYVAKHVAGSKLVVLPVTGHCAHLSAPDQVVTAIRDFLS